VPALRLGDREIDRAVADLTGALSATASRKWPAIGRRQRQGGAHDGVELFVGKSDW
jgi:hypothetical protein